MKNSQPLFDPATRYRIEIRDRADAAWLQSFDGLAEIIVDETRQLEDSTVFDVHTDQAGIVGLLRRLHSLGMTIQQFHIIQKDG